MLSFYCLLFFCVHFPGKSIIADCLYPSDTGRTVGTEEDRKYFSDEVIELLAFIDRTDCAVGTTFIVMLDVTCPYFTPVRFFILPASGALSFYEFTTSTAIQATSCNVCSVGLICKVFHSFHILFILRILPIQPL